MKSYQPMRVRERAAAAVVSSTVSLSVVAGLLLLFNDGCVPGLSPGDSWLNATCSSKEAGAPEALAQPSESPCPPAAPGAVADASRHAPRIDVATR